MVYLDTGCLLKLYYPEPESAAVAEENGPTYDFVFVDQIGFNKHAPKTFAALVASFTKYKA